MILAPQALRRHRSRGLSEQFQKPSPAEQLGQLRTQGQPPPKPLGRARWRFQHVIQLSNGTQYRGTSFGCAFASAATITAMNSLSTTNFRSLLSRLSSRADKSFSNYSNPHHGNGIIRV